MPQLIQSVTPIVILSSNIDRILEQMAHPEKTLIQYDFTFRLNMNQITELIEWLGNTGFALQEADRIKENGTAVPMQLAVDFIKGVEILMKGK